MKSVSCSRSPIQIASPNGNVELTPAISWPMAVAPSSQTPIHSAQKTIWSLPTWMVANNGLGSIEQLL